MMHQIPLKSILKTCQTHLDRLDYAYKHTQSLLPFDTGKVQALTEAEISYLDQYIFRFAKLQDAIGQSLFKAVLQYLGEEVHDKAFIDVFHKMEQLHIIDDYDQWQKLRIIRNEVAHEYGESPVQLAEKLNALLQSKPVLEQYFNSIVAYLNQREEDINE